jgi:thymidylate kinase
MNKNIKKLIKEINKQECSERISQLMILLDFEINVDCTKISNNNLHNRDDYENAIYSKLKNII